MPMSKQMRKMLIIVMIVFGLIFGWYAVRKIIFWWFLSHYEPPAVTVSASSAKTKTWQSFLSSVGTVTAINGVDISSEVAGAVKEIRFESGKTVNKGDVLITLDTSVEVAQLKDNESQLKLAQINYERDKTLAQKNVLSKASFDTTTAKLQQAQAGVEQTLAKINQKTIRAPFAGKLGIRQVDLGQYLAAGTNMVTLEALDPLYVRFNLPEQYLHEIFQGQPVDIIVNLTNQPLTIHGTVTAINSKVDQTTRNILAQATFSNANSQLYPGMFAAIKVWQRQQKNVITLPQSSISYSLHGDSVFIIKSDKKDSDGNPILHAYRQYVKVGERRGDEVVLLEGVKPGDQVVTSGQLKLQNGMHVEIDNNVEL